MVQVSILIKEGEQILAQATHELTKEVDLKDLMEKTLPGLQEHICQLLVKAEEGIDTLEAKIENA